MPQTPFDALALAPFAVYLRPEDGLFLPGYEGAAFRRGFGSVFKSIACPAHPVDCLHARLGQRSVYSEVFETPVPSDSGVMRERREKDHLLLRAWVFMPDLAAAGFPAQKHGGLRMTCIWLFSQNRGIQPANGIGVR